MTLATDRPAEPPALDLVTVTIDGFEIRVPKGTLIIRPAEQLGIQIPRFCDHPLLDPIGACRQCLVEVTDAGLVLLVTVTRGKPAWKQPATTEERAELGWDEVVRGVVGHVQGGDAQEPAGCGRVGEQERGLRPVEQLAGRAQRR